MGIEEVLVRSAMSLSEGAKKCVRVESELSEEFEVKVGIIIIMVIFKCYFSGEHIALSIKKTKQQQQRCEHRIRKNQQIKSTVDDAN